jgi:hypothetical protein
MADVSSILVSYKDVNTVFIYIMYIQVYIYIYTCIYSIYPVTMRSNW